MNNKNKTDRTDKTDKTNMTEKIKKTIEETNPEEENGILIS